MNTMRKSIDANEWLIRFVMTWSSKSLFNLKYSNDWERDATHFCDQNDDGKYKNEIFEKVHVTTVIFHQKRGKIKWSFMIFDVRSPVTLTVIGNWYWKNLYNLLFHKNKEYVTIEENATRVMSVIKMTTKDIKTRSKSKTTSRNCFFPEKGEKY